MQDYLLKKLQELRKKYNYNQADFAEILDITQSTYHRKETGKIPITIEELQKIRARIKNQHPEEVDLEQYFKIFELQLPDDPDIDLKKTNHLYRSKYFEVISLVTKIFSYDNPTLIDNLLSILSALDSTIKTLNKPTDKTK